MSKGITIEDRDWPALVTDIGDKQNFVDNVEKVAPYSIL